MYNLSPESVLTAAVSRMYVISLRISVIAVAASSLDTRTHAHIQTRARSSVYSVVCVVNVARARVAVSYRLPSPCPSRRDNPAPRLYSSVRPGVSTCSTASQRVLWRHWLVMSLAQSGLDKTAPIVPIYHAGNTASAYTLRKAHFPFKNLCMYAPA